jgi:ABC-type multidrug transport system ATPase subunit
VLRRHSGGERRQFCRLPGEILGYLGLNGSGKSTTVKMIAGPMEPTRGAVLFHGVNIRHDLSAYKKLLGYVPEKALLYPCLTGREYLEFVAPARHGAEADAHAVIPIGIKIIPAPNSGRSKKILFAVAIT